MGCGITAETRLDAYQGTLCARRARRSEVYDVLLSGAMTAEEITETLCLAGVLNRFDMNYVRPRLTELKADGLVVAVGKKRSPRTGKCTAVWAVKNGTQGHCVETRGEY